jgi:mevalonate kinase
MGRRLDNHPYYVLLEKSHPSDVISSDQPSRQKAAIESDSFSIDAQKDFSKFLLRIDACEPNQPVSISIRSGIPFKATICSSSPAVDYPHIAVTNDQQKIAYRKHIQSPKTN